MVKEFGVANKWVERRIKYIFIDRLYFSIEKINIVGRCCYYKYQVLNLRVKERKIFMGLTWELVKLAWDNKKSLKLGADSKKSRDVKKSTCRVA